MDQFRDQDGTSKTSGAVDQDYYRDGNSQENSVAAEGPTESEIARLAYRIWEERGRPSGTHDQDWAEAEHQLRQESDAPQDYRILKEQQGSVQR